MGQSIDAEIRGRKREDSIHRHTGWKPPGSLVAWQGTGYAWAARPEGAVVLSVDENGTGEDALSCQQSSLPRGGTYDFAKGTTGVVFDPSPTVRAAATSTKSTLAACIFCVRLLVRFINGGIRNHFHRLLRALLSSARAAGVQECRDSSTHGRSRFKTARQQPEAY